MPPFPIHKLDFCFKRGRQRSLCRVFHCFFNGDKQDWQRAAEFPPQNHGVLSQERVTFISPKCQIDTQAW